MKQYITIGAVAALTALCATVQAVPITGEINFQNGGVHLNGTIGTGGSATAITQFINPSSVDSGILGPTGSFLGTGGFSGVTFVPTGFQFLPNLIPNPVTLWTFTDLGQTYSFSMTSVGSTFGSAGLTLSGGGTITITGGSTTYDPTIGTWSIAITGSGTGPDGLTFGFVAGTTAGVPDGGTTLTLLGTSLAGLSLLKRKFMA